MITPKVVKRFDLTKTTFIIPLRIETADRMRNIITILIYLTRNFDTKIIVKEVDESSVYEREVLPVLKQALEPEWLECIHHIFEKSEEFTFHRTKILNDMLWMVDTPVVVNYDSDILLPLESYINATNMIAKGWVHPDVENGKPVKVIYPYGCGNYQFQCHVGDNEVTNFINSGFNYEYFNGHMRQWDAKYGFCQFFDTEEYKKLGGENENFVAYGYEDDERHFRFNLLSSVARIDDYVYHLEHGRTKNSWFNNPYCEDNKKLWEILKVKGKKSLIKYYEEVDYLKERNG
jgi:predicted glycosyltransferase involved in capsule biosynthesis